MDRFMNERLGKDSLAGEFVAQEVAELVDGDCGFRKRRGVR